MSFRRRQALHANQGQGLIPTFLHRSTVQSSPPPGNCLASLFSQFDPNEFGSALHPLRQALLGRGHVCWSLVQPLSLFLFFSFCGFGNFLFILRHFFVLPSFHLLPSKNRSLAETLISTFALRCEWMIKDVFLLPRVFALEQGYTFLRVEFQTSKPGGRGAEE